MILIRPLPEINIFCFCVFVITKNTDINIHFNIIFILLTTKLSFLFCWFVCLETILLTLLFTVTNQHHQHVGVWVRVGA